MSKSDIEHKNQVQFMRWCAAHRVDIKGSDFYLPFAGPKETIADFIYAVPNGGKRPQKQKAVRGKVVNCSPEGAKLKREGCKAGVHDLFFPAPLWGFSGLYMELKKPVSKDYAVPTVSAEQKDFGSRMQRAGYAVVYCWGFDQLVIAMKAYMTGDKDILEGYSIPRASRRKDV